MAGRKAQLFLISHHWAWVGNFFGFFWMNPQIANHYCLSKIQVIRVPTRIKKIKPAKIGCLAGNPLKKGFPATTGSKPQGNKIYLYNWEEGLISCFFIILIIFDLLSNHYSAAFDPRFTFLMPFFKLIVMYKYRAFRHLNWIRDTPVKYCLYV